MRCLRSINLIRIVIILTLFSQMFLFRASGSPSAGITPWTTLTSAHSESLNLTLSLAVDLNSTKEGTEVTATGLVAYLNGTGVASEVSIELSNPYGSTVGLRLAPTNPTGSFHAQFIIPSESPAGTYSVFVTACRGGICAAQSTSFILSPLDFVINVAPKSVSIQEGETATFNVTLLPVAGFNSTVEMSVLNLPNGTSFTFSQSSIPPHGSTQLNIVTSPATPVGVFTALIIARGGGKEHSVAVILSIRPASSLNEWIALTVFAAFILAAIGLALWRRRRGSSAGLRLEEDQDALAVVRALARLEELKAVGKVTAEEYEKLRKEYDRRLERLRGGKEAAGG